MPGVESPGAILHERSEPAGRGAWMRRIIPRSPPFLSPTSRNDSFSIPGNQVVPTSLGTTAHQGVATDLATIRVIDEYRDEYRHQQGMIIAMLNNTKYQDYALEPPHPESPSGWAKRAKDIADN